MIIQTIGMAQTICFPIGKLIAADWIYTANINVNLQLTRVE